jgi:hypothetical protein
MNRSITSNWVSRVKGRLRVGVLCSFTVLAAPAASTCGAPPNPLAGTWYGTVSADGAGYFPNFSPLGLKVGISTTFRWVVTESSGNLVEQLELCNLSLRSTTDPNALVTTFNTAALATMVGTASIPTFTPTVGGPVTIPPITIQTGSNIPCNGSCVAADFIDSDHDSNPGTSISANIGGSLSLVAYSSLTIPTTMTDAVLTDANTIDGWWGFSAKGQILKTTFALYPGGPISVTPYDAASPFTAKKLAGNVPCSTVLTSP